MAVNISKSGGIYIEISGDVAKLRESLAEADRLAKTSGKSISETLSGALTPKDAARVTGNIAKYFQQAAISAKAASADLSQYNDKFQAIGKTIGVAEKDLQKFAATNVKALQTQTQKAFLDNLKGIQRVTGQTDAEMNKLAKSLGGVGDEFSRVGREAQQMAQSSSAGLASVALRVGAVAAAYISLRTITRAVGEFIGSGIDYNRQLQDAELGISTVLALNNKIIDSQGRMLQGVEKFNAAQTISVDIVKRLDAASISFMGEFSDLLSGFQSALGLAQSKGIGWQDTIDMVVLMGNTMKAANVDIQLLDKEMRRFLTGQDLQNSHLLKILSDVDANIVKAWGNGTKYVKNFTNALKESQYAGEAAQKTYSVSTAAVKENLQSLAAEMTKPLFQGLSESAYEFAGALYEIDTATGTWKVKDNMQPLVDIGKEIADKIGKVAVAGVSALTSGLEGLGTLVHEDGEDISSFFNAVSITLSSIADTTFENTKTFLEWAKQQKDNWGAGGFFVPEDMDMTGLSNGLAKNAKELEKQTIAFFKPELASVQPVLDSIDKVNAYLRETQEEAGKASEGLDLVANASGVQMDDKAAKKLADTIKSINTEIARLTMTEKEFARFQLEQKIEEYKKLGISAGKLKELEVAFAKSQISKAFTEASKAVQDFEKEYRKAFKSGEAAAASVRAEMDKFRDAAYAAGLSAEELKVVLQRIAELQARKLEDVATDAAAGAHRAFRNYSEDALNAAKNTETAINSSLSSMEDALVDFVKTGKLSFSSLVDSIIADLARLAVRQSITGPLSSALGSLFGNTNTAGGGTGSWAGSSASGGYDWLNLSPSAKGNVFSSPALSAYSNSIVGTPTVFPFAKGIGLMGEAGAEAIMPLSRTSGGDLGVKVDLGGSRQQAPQTTIQIIDQRGADAPEVEVQQAPSSNGGTDYRIIIKSELQRNAANGSLDGIMMSRYGVRPRVRGR